MEKKVNNTISFTCNIIPIIHKILNFYWEGKVKIPIIHKILNFYWEGKGQEGPAVYPFEKACFTVFNFNRLFFQQHLCHFFVVWN